MCATEAVEPDPRPALAALAATWQVPCDADQLEALVGYGQLLLRWNARINLTGARSLTALVEAHFPDAFALARWLDDPERLIDVGSGGGLPAVPLALLRPGLDVQLCEPVAKKAAFLRTAIRELGLGGRVRLDTRRAGELAQAGERFDAAVSRATFAPDVWLALGRRLVRPGGRVFALTTPQAGATAGLGNLANLGRTDGRTDGRTGGRTDGRTDGRTQLYGHGRRLIVEIVV